MKKISLVIFSLLLFIGLGVSCDKADNDQSSDDEIVRILATEIEGSDLLTGEAVKLSDFKGKVVLINFWATWCPPCKMEIPDLIELSEDYQEDFVVLGVSMDSVPSSEVEAFVREQGMTYPVIMGSDQMVMDYGGISGIPTSFFVDRDGYLVGMIVGYRSYSQFESAMLPFINE